MKIKYISVLLILVTLSAWADVKLPRVFSSHMVLQRNAPIPVWGWADKNEKVSISFNGQVQITKADATGKWMVKLNAIEAGGPYQLVVSGKKNQVAFDDVLVGEVWVCSGQSNMEWPLKTAANANQEIANANYPQIRHFGVAHKIASNPQSDLDTGEWKPCTPTTAGDFTAVGYFFGRELFKTLNVPIGLLHTSWGGTHSETWTSKEALLASDEFKDLAQNLQIDIESIGKAHKERLEKLVSSQQSTAAPQDATNWKESSFDDSQWRTMNLPSIWEEKGLPDLDGVVWFRKEFVLTAEQAKKGITVSLNTIDDDEITYLNGQKIGATTGYNIPRNYEVPASMLKEGRNVLAVRVVDGGGGGGIYGNNNDLLVKSGDTSIPLAGPWRYRIERYSASEAVSPNAYPTLLFNAMLNPLIPYAIKGAIWYQGESNAGRAYQYRKAFPMMIQDWRNHWQQGDFPFLFVQLANYNNNLGDSQKGSTWAELREAQTQTLSLAKTGMACIIDIGEARDIHPRNKQDVGKRLAAIALHDYYGQSVPYSGPMYKGFQKTPDGILLEFDHIGSGLLANDKYGYVKGFEIAGTDQKFYYAQALIKGNQILVFSNKVPDPVAVRYGWADNPEDVNLYNKEGFPASPFRTDTWKGVTEANKFQIGR
ncbi:MAG: sialate O-acetylesterase [Spirosomataceae bacterium]